jgi:hypothetical protein
MTVILVTGWISIHWLDPRNLDKPSTVLGRLYRFSLKETWHGAVMGSDIRVNDLLAAGRNWLVRLAIRCVPGWLGVADTLAAIEKPWGQITPRARDFVIPSVSQAMHLFDDPQGPRPPKFLGNALNAKGTHISGGDETDSDSDSGVVRSMLDALGNQLHRGSDQTRWKIRSLSVALHSGGLWPSRSALQTGRTGALPLCGRDLIRPMSSE